MGDIELLIVFNILTEDVTYSIFEHCWCFIAGNCIDPGWLIQRKYTPGAPEGLKVEVDTRHDKKGRLQPVLVAQWELKDEGMLVVCVLNFPFTD